MTNNSVFIDYCLSNFECQLIFFLNYKKTLIRQEKIDYKVIDETYLTVLNYGRGYLRFLLLLNKYKLKNQNDGHLAWKRPPEQKCVCVKLHCVYLCYTPHTLHVNR